MSSNTAPVMTPTWRWIWQHPARWLAFGFGSGLIRPAPGTWGTLAAWLLWWALLARLGLPDVAMAFFLILAFALGCRACGRTGKDLGAPDHGGMVFDEIVAFWLVLWLVPADVLTQALAFGLFRVFDIAKPFPIRQFDARCKNGFGVMADDLLAAGYTVLVILVLQYLEWLPW